MYSEDEDDQDEDKDDENYVTNEKNEAYYSLILKISTK